MAKKTSSNYHITPSAGGGWAAKRAGATRAASIHQTQAEAIAAGRDLARKSSGELRIHGTDGRIRNSNSYGNDPNPPRDAKH